MSALSSERCRRCHPSEVGIIIRAMSELSPEPYGHYHVNELCTTIRVLSLLSYVKNSRPLSCISKPIKVRSLVQGQSGASNISRAMLAISSEQCRHYHPRNVGMIIREMSAASSKRHYHPSNVNIIIQEMLSLPSERCRY